MFISVGIDPPTVAFPRNGAEIDCETPDPPRGDRDRNASLPGGEVFGRLRVFEETGREALGIIGAETDRASPAAAELADRSFVSRFTVSPGRHVVYFFQAPDPPAQATQPEIDAHFRAYAGLANTPTSKIVIERKPPRFQIPAGLAAVVGGLRGGFPGTTTNVPPPGQQGPALLGASDCANPQQTPSVLCALPFADINIRIGGRLNTTRADEDGNWSMLLPLAGLEQGDAGAGRRLARGRRLEREL